MCNIVLHSPSVDSLYSNLCIHQQPNHTVHLTTADSLNFLHTKHNPPPHPSLPQSSFLAPLASRASVFFLPHRFLIASNDLSCSFFTAGAEQHRLTKNCEHSNFSANRTRVHCFGSSSRNWRISSICSLPRWYFFSYSGRRGRRRLAGLGVAPGAEVVVEEGGGVARVCSFLLGSLAGRNFEGVW